MQSDVSFYTAKKNKKKKTYSTKQNTDQEKRPETGAKMIQGVKGEEHQTLHV